MYGQNFEWDVGTFEAAVENGNLENMKWLMAHGCPYDETTFGAAAYEGNLENIKWLLVQNQTSPGGSMG